MPDEDSEQLSIFRRLIELSAERSYLNAERTLSVWVRTALGLMILGLAVDRFGMILFEITDRSGGNVHDPDALSNWIGIALVALGIAMAFITGLRFYLYGVAYRRQHQPPDYHHPVLGPFFAVMVMLCGVALLVILAVATK